MHRTLLCSSCKMCLYLRPVYPRTPSFSGKVLTAGPLLFSELHRALLLFEEQRLASVTHKIATGSRREVRNYRPVTMEGEIYIALRSLATFLLNNTCAVNKFSATSCRHCIKFLQDQRSLQQGSEISRN